MSIWFKIRGEIEWINTKLGIIILFFIFYFIILIINVL